MKKIEPKQTPQTQRWLSDDTCGAPFRHKLKSQAVRICHIASGQNYHCSSGTAGIHAWQKLMELLLELMARRMTRSTSNSTHSLILQQSSSALYHLPSHWPWREVHALARPSVLFFSSGVAFEPISMLPTCTSTFSMVVGEDHTWIWGKIAYITCHMLWGGGP